MEKKTNPRKIYYFRLLGSLVLAILLWLVLNGESNNILERDFNNIPVSLVNKENLLTRDLAIDQDQTYYVNLVVRGTDENLNEINTNELSAEVDLDDVVGAGEQDLDIIIRGLNNSVILERTVPSKIQIEVSDLKESTYTPEILPEGKPGNDLTVISAKTDEEVSVYGPDNLIQEIDKISGVVDVDGITMDSYQYVDLYAYNSDGERIEDLRLNPSTVGAEIVLGVTKDVSVTAPTVEGALPNGYKISSVEVQPDSVVLAGKPDVINTITSVGVQPISLPSANQTSSFNESSTFLIPDGVTLLKQDEKVNVNVVIEQVVERSFTVSDISSVNLKEGLSIDKIDPSSVTVKVKGTASELSKIDPSKLIGTVNLENLGKGEYDVPITINLSEVEVLSVTPDKVNVKIT